MYKHVSEGDRRKKLREHTVESASKKRKCQVDWEKTDSWDRHSQLNISPTIPASMERVLTTVKTARVAVEKMIIDPRNCNAKLIR